MSLLDLAVKLPELFNNLG